MACAWSMLAAGPDATFHKYRVVSTTYRVGTVGNLAAHFEIHIALASWHGPPRRQCALWRLEGTRTLHSCRRGRGVHVHMHATLLHACCIGPNHQSRPPYGCVASPAFHAQRTRGSLCKLWVIGILERWQATRSEDTELFMSRVESVRSRLDQYCASLLLDAAFPRSGCQRCHYRPSAVRTHPTVQLQPHDGTLSEHGRPRRRLISIRRQRIMRRTVYRLKEKDIRTMEISVTKSVRIHTS